MDGALIGGRNGFFLHIQRTGLIAEKAMVIVTEQVLADHVEILPATKIEMTLQGTVVIENVYAFRRVVQINQATLVADIGRVGNRIEELAEVGGLVHQRAIV